jgi:type VI secretion system secreted protein VgrG
MKIFNKISVAVLVVAFALGLAGLAIAATTVSLGTADSFAILAGSGITIAGGVNTSTITGDVGTFPTATITGIGNAVLNGTNQAGGTITQGAKTDLAAAYNDALSRSPAGVGGGIIDQDLSTFNGGILTPGVYKDNGSPDSLGITGTLTLDGQNDPNSVFIFQASSTLTTAAASSVILTNGAQACHVFWQVGSSATLGADSFFKGNILATTTITLGTTVDVEGRLLAVNGAVTLDGTDTITEALCNPTLTVTKEVVGGGPKAYTDFPLFVDAVSVTTGVATTTVAGAHVVTETTDSNYTQTFSDSCPGGSITLAAGQDYACTITNTYVTPQSSHGSGGGGTHYGCKDPNALNYEYFAASNPALCLYTATSTTVVYPATAIAYTTATTTGIVYKLPNTGINDGTGPTKEEAVVTFYRSLSIGAQGADVVVLQTALEQKDLLTIPSGVTKGYFGTLTRKAVTKYQANVNLPTVGIFGPLTRAKLTSELGE